MPTVWLFAEGYAHTYNEGTAKLVVRAIREKYLPLFKRLGEMLDREQA